MYFEDQIYSAGSGVNRVQVVFIRDDLKVKSISVTAANHVEVITAELPDVVVHSVYKPPSEQFVLPPLGNRSLPQIVIGDFNSHNTIWGYDATDNNGVAVVQWAESNSLTRIHDAKLQKSFNSARWKKGYNPDLIFVSSSIDNMCVKSVLNPIPRTQHRPICVTVNPVLVSRPTAFRRRFNLRKANIYTNDQPLHDGTRNFVYADDLCVTAQYPSFTEVEHTIEEALDELTTYYRSNSLRANPDKTQVTSFHLKNRGKEDVRSQME